MSKPSSVLPSVLELISLLETLKRRVQEFAAREDQLNQDLRHGLAKADADFVAIGDNQESVANRHMLEAQARLASELTRIRVRRDQLLRRISRAHDRMTERGTSEISSHDRLWSERTQEIVAGLEQQRDADLGRVREARQDFERKLADAETQLALLRDQAASSVRGFPILHRKLFPGAAPAASVPSAGPVSPPQAFLDEAGRLQKAMQASLLQFRRSGPFFLAAVTRWKTVAILLALLALAHPVLQRWGFQQVTAMDSEMAGGCLGLWCGLYFLAGHLAGPFVTSLAGLLAQAAAGVEAGRVRGAEYHAAEEARAAAQFESGRAAAHQAWREAVRDLNQQREAWPGLISEKALRLETQVTRWHSLAAQEMQDRHEAELEELKAVDLETVRANMAAHEARIASLQEAHRTGFEKLSASWREEIQGLCARLEDAIREADKISPPWSSISWEAWTPPRDSGAGVRFGSLEVPVKSFLGRLPVHAGLAWPGPPVWNLPLVLVSPLQGSILFESGKASGEEAFGVIHNIIFRLLASSPPGRLSFTIFDPVGLGQNFAALMHLADYEDANIESRIWTQPAQFEEKLAELNEHMEKIIQMYLRNEYASIAEYNAAAGSVAEKYHYLVIASFPVNFSENAARRLRNIAASGARCGVHLLMHWDQRNAPPTDFVPDELRQNTVGLVHDGRGFGLARGLGGGVRAHLDPPPSPEVATAFLHRVGQVCKNANRVEVPFRQIAPEAAGIWGETTTERLRVPIGRAGATKLQNLELGVGTRQHVLVAGKTGSGKSTLFHVLITNLALRCSPLQVEFYLVDFKKGVEFKCYASRRLPHARVVAIESDRRFGLSVLQRVDEELRRRGDRFRQLGAQDLAGFARAGGEPMPRTLLIIDEFQEFFTEEDSVSQGAAVLLDRIVRQGRAFGIHVLLGSQTLGGAYTLARATMGQMVVRIALQCNEADALLIMDQDNPAPRLLSRPGEGIYNDAAGAIEGNSPFQAVWLSDQDRDFYLAQVRERADHQPELAGLAPVVFEGNAPADVVENTALNTALGQVNVARPDSVALWLGTPNAIKGPTAARFRRQSGANLLLVCQSEERSTDFFSLGILGLAAQYPKDGARFLVLSQAPAGTPVGDWWQSICGMVPQPMTMAGPAAAAEMLLQCVEMLKQRADEPAAGPEVYLVIHSLQQFKKLRQEDDFSFGVGGAGDAPGPAALLQRLITEGPALGVHVLLSCDTYNNVGRFLGRKLLSEFEMRVVCQMSASDSASLVDAPDASTLGLHRALYYNDREGLMETFRPYARPEASWLAEAGRRLGRRV